MTIKPDTNGLGRSIAIEGVLFRVEDGEEKFVETEPLKVVAEDGNVLTYELKTTLRESGVFRYSYRIYPCNKNLPHRQDFAYVRWI